MQKSMADVVKEETRTEEAIRSRQEMLLRLLRNRFGKVPRGITSAIEATTDLERLEGWFDRAATANTL
jgi:hypothetical protein